MKAIIASYKPGDYDNTRKETMTKDLLAYTQWIMRAGQRGYTAIQDTMTGTIYVIHPEDDSRNAFEVKFDF